MRTCQYCCEKDLIVVGENVYCSTCESYFTYKKGVQEHVFVPIEEIDQITLHGNLCCKCEKKYEKNIKITCLTFSEYFSGLSLCAKCKKRNFKYIKNAYHKNFILYKAKERACSILYIIFMILTWFIFYNSNIIFTLSVYFLERKFGSRFLYSLIVTALVLSIKCYISSLLVYGYLIYKMMTTKRNIFKVPQNLENVPDIDEHIKSLTICNK